MITMDFYFTGYLWPWWLTKKLKKLFLYNNKIKKIENISHLEQLSVLWLNNNNIIAIEVWI